MPPTGVYLSSADFVDGNLIESESADLRDLATALIRLRTIAPASGAPLGPTRSRRGIARYIVVRNCRARPRPEARPRPAILRRQRRGRPAAAPLLPRQSPQAFFFEMAAEAEAHRREHFVGEIRLVRAR